ncbi:S-adenosyl-L-methionine-dependent methyltransferase [Fomes fomentarius]|nr:S-adenosyl-L-methionine-dependent methyltransferase [Fomes fomentarius]
MAELTHYTIQDGWFKEISPEWPGQAMSLKVNKILHVEQSLYQDVLCTERDEFSYQEMISHLPLASHPCPKKVLVVGGGDGGVVREVLKHESVEHVVLCDIDEAVIRVSKQYLLHMSSLVTDPRVKIHIGDGLQFLSRIDTKYDVIITDCSDPDGPAVSLFEQPYFELLSLSLNPGGHISIQAESMWLHLPTIRDLLDTARPFFPIVEYAYATVPTYPSGQIGYLVASLEPQGDVKTPVRAVHDTRYYNAEIHTAAFALPEFCRVFLKDGKDIRPHIKMAMTEPLKVRRS